MVARAILPALGGTPAVWNTCMVFFQAALLAGYGYAHLLSSRTGPRVQTAVHAAVVLATLLALPIGLGVGSSPPSDGNPIPWLLWTLLTSVGVPFLLLSTTSPLLQRWFAGAGDRSSADP
jgi:hypothetical protein